MFGVKFHVRCENFKSDSTYIYIYNKRQNGLTAHFRVPTNPNYETGSDTDFRSTFSMLYQAVICMYIKTVNTIKTRINTTFIYRIKININEIFAFKFLLVACQVTTDNFFTTVDLIHTSHRQSMCILRLW